MFRISRTLALVGLTWPLTTSLLHAQDPRLIQPDIPPAVERVAPLAPTTTPPPTEEELRMLSEPVLENLTGLLFVSDPESVREQGVSVRGVDVSNAPLLQDQRLLRQLKSFLGHPASLGTLELIRNVVSTHLSQSGRPFVSVLLPPQDITEGAVQFLLVEGRLGTLSVEGNRHFSDRQLTAPIRIRPGDVIERNRVESGVAWINRNPFRVARVEASAGEAFGATDLKLQVQDRLPLRVYAGFDNNGTETTDYERVNFGFNWGNVFGLGHLLNYQFTASPDFEKLRAHAASYIIDLPWHHSLALSASYMEAAAELPEPFDQRGITLTLGLRYIVELPQLAALTHSVSFGFDYKRVDNTLLFARFPVVDFLYEVAEFSIGYDAALPDRFGETRLFGSLFYSPGGLFSHDNDLDYSFARANADSEFVYAHLTLARTQPLPWSWLLELSATGQLSSTNLQGTEQMILGGATGVRGFGAGDAYVDQGALLRAELYTPPIKLFSRLASERNRGGHFADGTPRASWLQDQLRFLAFYDFGYGRSKHPLPGETSQTLQAAGVGLRYALRNNLSIAFDYAWQLNADNIFNDYDSRAHLSVQVAY